MSDDVHNIHDAFSREVFSDPDRAAAFFEQFLPAHLLEVFDLTSLQVSKESYTTRTLKEYFSDLVFIVALKKPGEGSVRIALLFEHKSEPDSHVLFQVGHYMFFHWMKCIRKKKPIYPIIPLIYYQGKVRWEIPELKAMFEQFPESIIQYSPVLPHIFLPLKDIPEHKILDIRNAMMISAILAQKSKIHPIHLAEDFLRILTLFPHETGDRNFFETLIVYTYNVSKMSDDQMKEVIHQLPKPVKQEFMTTYEMIINKGLKEGELKGEMKEKIDVIVTSFQNGLSISLIAKITRMTIDEVEKVLSEKGLL